MKETEEEVEEEEGKEEAGEAGSVPLRIHEESPRPHHFGFGADGWGTEWLPAGLAVSLLCRKRENLAFDARKASVLPERRLCTTWESAFLLFMATSNSSEKERSGEHKENKDRCYWTRNAYLVFHNMTCVSATKRRYWTYGIDPATLIIKDDKKS